MSALMASFVGSLLYCPVLRAASPGKGVGWVVGTRAEGKLLVPSISISEKE